jgi:hypothetical protein
MKAKSEVARFYCVSCTTPSVKSSPLAILFLCPLAVISSGRKMSPERKTRISPSLTVISNLPEKQQKNCRFVAGCQTPIHQASVLKKTNLLTAT